MLNGKEEILINSNKAMFFHQYLLLKKPIIDKMLRDINGNGHVALHEIPLQIFAKLLYYNDIYKKTPEEERWPKIFNKQIRRKIQEELGLNERLFNTHLSNLRKIGILKGRSINPLFLIHPEKDYTLSYKFNIAE